MKLLTFTTTLFYVAGALGSAAPSTQDTQGTSLRTGTDARGVTVLQPLTCNPPCHNCDHCVRDSSGKPYCKNMGPPPCRNEASTEIANEVAVTEKRAPVDQPVSRREPIVLHPRACDPPCKGCDKCAMCDFGKPCCKRLSPHCSPEASTEAINEDVDQVISSREPKLLRPRACNPPCKGCDKCAMCDFGNPCCKRLSPHCGPEASTETVNEVAVTEKRAAVDQHISRREPILLHVRACNPPCQGCLKCALCDFGKPCCKRLSSHCGPEASIESENDATVDQKRTPEVEAGPLCKKNKDCPKGWECKPCLMGHCCKAPKKSEISIRVTDPEILEPSKCPQQCQKCYFCVDCNGTPCCKRFPGICSDAINPSE